MNNTEFVNNFFRSVWFDDAVTLTFFNSNSTNNYDVQEVDKRIGGILKQASGSKSLINMGESFQLNGEIVNWNPENWSCWINKIASFHKVTPLHKPLLNRVENIINQKMLRQLPVCRAGICSQVAKSAGSLAIHSEDLNTWLYENASSKLSDFSAKEFYMLIHGSAKLMDAKQLNKLLSRYSGLLEDDQRRNQFLHELKPNGIACILKACVAAKYSGLLNKLLLQSVIEKLPQFDLNSKVDVIAGLSEAVYQLDSQTVFLKVLEKIERELVEEPLLSNKSLSLAVNHFAQAGYVPFQLLPVVKKRLQSSLEVWEKISLFHSLSLLGLVEDYRLLFYRLMQELQEESCGKQLFEKIYEQDLIRFIHAAAIYLPFQDQDQHPLISSICAKLQKRAWCLSREDREQLFIPLRAMGHFDAAEKLTEEVVLEGRASPIQLRITKKVIAESSLSRLRVYEEGDFKGIKVDLLITGFDRIGLSQKPLIIEIDGPYHWACNSHQHRLGNYYLRSNVLKRFGCEFSSFDLRKGESKVFNQIRSYLENKKAKWTGQYKQLQN